MQPAQLRGRRGPLEAQGPCSQPFHPLLQGLLSAPSLLPWPTSICPLSSDSVINPSMPEKQGPSSHISHAHADSRQGRGPELWPWCMLKREAPLGRGAWKATCTQTSVVSRRGDSSPHPAEVHTHVVMFSHIHLLVYLQPLADQSFPGAPNGAPPRQEDVERESSHRRGTQGKQAT